MPGGPDSALLALSSALLQPLLGMIAELMCELSPAPLASSAAGFAKCRQDQRSRCSTAATAQLSVRAAQSDNLLHSPALHCYPLSQATGNAAAGRLS